MQNPIMKTMRATEGVLNWREGDQGGAASTTALEVPQSQEKYQNENHLTTPNGMGNNGFSPCVYQGGDGKE